MIRWGNKWLGLTDLHFANLGIPIPYYFLTFAY